MTEPSSQVYRASVSLPVSVEEAFAYHDRPGALERLIPPWESVAIEQTDGSLAVGSRVVIKTPLFGFPLRWVAEHTEYEPPRRFADTQVSGPFAAWYHRHLFEPQGTHYSVLTDEIEYRLPLGIAGRVFGGGKALRTIEAMFAYRHRVTRDDLSLRADYESPSLSVAVSGSNGLVGKQLSALLTLLGHRVFPITRSPRAELPEAIAAWESDSEAARLSEMDVVVHLAGKSIAAGRWNEAAKREIRDSRVSKTRALCDALARLERKPKVLVCASATGIYGDRGEEALDETAAPGDDFLAEVATAWEEACQPARDAGIRVVNARLGMVLSPRDHALKKMLLPAKFFGGALGSGKQWWNWIALEDAIGAIYHAMQTDSVVGPVNVVSPQPIRNRDFAAVLANVVGRVALFPAPAFGMRMAMGEMADALLLASTRAIPRRLQESDYRFRFTDLSEALRFYLGRERLASAE